MVVPGGVFHEVAGDVTVFAPEDAALERELALFARIFALTVAEVKRDAPLLRDTLARHRPRVAWFHGRQALDGYLRHGEGREPSRAWGEQPSIAGCRVFVTPNPSPANAAYSLETLIDWYRRLAAFAEML